MSLFAPLNIVCPECETLITMDAVGSVNADRRPDFRDDILHDSFQDVSCGNCGHALRLQPNFNYLDAGRGQWIAGLPANQVSQYLEVEDGVSLLFDQCYGSKAPKAARDVGDGLDVRLTFGWPAIREKILAREHGLDDVVLEMLKLDLLRRMPEAPLAEGMELRMTGVTEDRLSFAWMETASEAIEQEVSVDRVLYDDIAANRDEWSKISARLTDGPFVDIQKIYLEEPRAA